MFASSLLLRSEEPLSLNRLGSKIPGQVISTWGTRCGIAKYSEHLASSLGTEVHVFANHAANLELPPECFVSRVWKDDNQDDLTSLINAVDRASIEVLVIQFNYGFFNFEHFNRFLKALHDRQISVILFMHCTVDPTNQPDKQLCTIKDALRHCARIMVHTIHDLNRLKHIGLVENVTLFPHGVLPHPARKDLHRSQDTFRIATYGFFLPHKGLIEIVDAVKILKDRGMSIMLHMINAQYPVSESKNLIREVEERIEALGLRQDIVVCTDFLTDQLCLEKLGEMDLIVYPYQSTDESTSGAVRYGIASGTPVAVTPLRIFDDVSEAVYRLPGIHAEAIAQGISMFYEEREKNLHDDCDKRAIAWHEAHTYESLGRRLHSIIHALHRDSSTATSVN